MTIRNLATKSALTVAAIAASFVIFSSDNAEARRGSAGRPAGGPPPLASANTTVRPYSTVSGCSIGRHCATTRANGGVVVTTHGTQGGPGRPGMQSGSGRPRR